MSDRLKGKGRNIKKEEPEGNAGREGLA